MGGKFTNDAFKVKGGLAGLQAGRGGVPKCQSVKVICSKVQVTILVAHWLNTSVLQLDFHLSPHLCFSPHPYVFLCFASPDSVWGFKGEDQLALCLQPPFMVSAVVSYFFLFSFHLLPIIQKFSKSLLNPYCSYDSAIVGFHPLL